MDIQNIKFDYEAPYRITNSKPLVTVLINNYNYCPYLSTAIDSALAQTWQPLEIIVVDDGSTDQSRAILDRYHDKIRVILKDNGGQASAFNAGINEAQGEIICFLDSDDFWYPEKVERVVTKYHEAPWGLVCHDLYEVDITGNKIGKQTHAQSTHCSLLTGNLLNVVLKKGYGWMFSPTSGMSLPIQIAKKIAPISEDEWRICADNPLAYGAICHAPVGVIDELLGAYRLHTENGFSVIRKNSNSLRLYALIVQIERYFFLKEYLKRIGLLIELKEPIDFYMYFRSFCFITKNKPWRCLRELWNLNVKEYFDASKGNRLKSLRSLKLLALDTLLAALMLMNLPNPYQAIRGDYLQRLPHRNPSVDNYLKKQ